MKYHKIITVNVNAALVDGQIVSAPIFLPTDESGNSLYAIPGPKNGENAVPFKMLFPYSLTEEETAIINQDAKSQLDEISKILSILENHHAAPETIRKYESMKDTICKKAVLNKVPEHLDKVTEEIKTLFRAAEQNPNVTLLNLKGLMKDVNSHLFKIKERILSALNGDVTPASSLNSQTAEATAAAPAKPVKRKAKNQETIPPRRRKLSDPNAATELPRTILPRRQAASAAIKRTQEVLATEKKNMWLNAKEEKEKLAVTTRPPLLNRQPSVTDTESSTSSSAASTPSSSGSSTSPSAASTPSP